MEVKDPGQLQKRDSFLNTAVRQEAEGNAKMLEMAFSAALKAERRAFGFSDEVSAPVEEKKAA